MRIPYVVALATSVAAVAFVAGLWAATPPFCDGERVFRSLAPTATERYGIYLVVKGQSFCDSVMGAAFTLREFQLFAIPRESLEKLSRTRTLDIPRHLEQPLIWIRHDQTIPILDD